MNKEKMLAILDEDFQEVLASSGQLELINSGESITCACCDRFIGLKDIQMILPLDNGDFSFVCDDTKCMERYVSALES